MKGGNLSAEWQFCIVNLESILEAPIFKELRPGK
jgi:hypothetical protein